MGQLLLQVWRERSTCAEGYVGCILFVIRSRPFLTETSLLVWVNTRAAISWWLSMCLGQPLTPPSPLSRPHPGRSQSNAHRSTYFAGILQHGRSVSLLG